MSRFVSSSFYNSHVTIIFFSDQNEKKIKDSLSLQFFSSQQYSMTHIIFINKQHLLTHFKK